MSKLLHKKCILIAAYLYYRLCKFSPGTLRPKLSIIVLSRVSNFDDFQP